MSFLTLQQSDPPSRYLRDSSHIYNTKPYYSFLTLPSKSSFDEAIPFLTLNSKACASTISKKEKDKSNRQPGSAQFLYFQGDDSHDADNKRNRGDSIATKEEISTQTEANLDFDKVNEIILDYKKHAASWKAARSNTGDVDVVNSSNEVPKRAQPVADLASREDGVSSNNAQSSEMKIGSKTDDKVPEPINESEESQPAISAISAQCLDLLQAVGDVSKAKELRLKSVRATLLALP